MHGIRIFMAPFWRDYQKKEMEHKEFYTEQNHPAEMNELPDEIRKKAISIANRMLADGNVRLHREIITAMAIVQARERAKEKAV